MPCRVMILRADDPAQTRAVSIPDDVSAEEALRHATQLIAELQSAQPDTPWSDIEAALEDQGFTSIETLVGPVWCTQRPRGRT